MDFVRADADQIDARVAKPLDFAPKALRGVDVQVDVRPLEPACDIVDRLNDPGLVVDVHHRDEQSVSSDGREHLSRIDGAVLAWSHERDLEAAPLQFGQRFQDRMMLDGRRDDVTGR